MEPDFTHVIRNTKLTKLSINSYSVILHTMISGKIYYLVASVRDTIPFREFLKCVVPDRDIFNYINGMNKKEKERLLKEDFNSIIDDVFVNKQGRMYNRLKMCNEQYKINIKKYTPLLKNPNVGLEIPLHIFPKGRKDNNETNRECALRELEEETHIDIETVKLYDIPPYEETYTGLDGMIYKTIYFVGAINYNDFTSQIDTITSKYLRSSKRTTVSEEIGTMSWCTYEDSIELLDSPKRYILRNINTYLLFNLPKHVIERRYSF